MSTEKKIKSFVHFSYEGDLLKRLANPESIFSDSKSKARIYLKQKEIELKGMHQSPSKYLDGKKTLDEKLLHREIEIIQVYVGETLEMLVKQHVNFLLAEKINNTPKKYFQRLKRELKGRYTLTEIRRKFREKYPNIPQSTIRNW